MGNMGYILNRKDEFINLIKIGLISDKEELNRYYYHNVYDL